jgi:hypothetical protein
MILYLVLHLCGGSYPQYILTKAAEPKLNNANETIKSVFSSLYGKILYYWFPPTDGYDVCPKWAMPNFPETNNSAETDDSAETDKYTITFVIKHSQHPLLLVEIMPPSDFQLDSARSAAMAQVIQHLDVVGPTNQFADRLYAISAIGKRWRACYALKGKGSASGQPVMDVAAANSLTNASPECWNNVSPECWNKDITTDDSWAALKRIVDTIKGYVDPQEANQ